MLLVYMVWVFGMHLKKGILCLPLIIGLFFALFLCQFLDSPQYDYPPLVQIHGVIFKGSSQSLPNLPQNSIYLGNILSSVSSSEIPVNDFEANDNLVGSAVYQAEDYIIIYHNNQWWIYNWK